MRGPRGDWQRFDHATQRRLTYHLHPKKKKIGFIERFKLHRKTINDEEYDSRPVPFNEGIKQAWEWLKKEYQPVYVVRDRRRLISFKRGPNISLVFEGLPIPQKLEGFQGHCC